MDAEGASYPVESIRGAAELFRTFRKRKLSLAITVDEFGGVTGLVTMEDVFETLLGLEIVDESDSIEDLQEYARRKWEERARRFRTIERTREPEDLSDQEQESDKDEEEHNPTQ